MPYTPLYDLSRVSFQLDLTVNAAYVMAHSRKCRNYPLAHPEHTARNMHWSQAIDIHVFWTSASMLSVLMFALPPPKPQSSASPLLSIIHTYCNSVMIFTLSLYFSQIADMYSVLPTLTHSCPTHCAYVWADY